MYFDLFYLFMCVFAMAEQRLGAGGDGLVFYTLADFLKFSVFFWICVQIIWIIKYSHFTTIFVEEHLNCSDLFKGPDQIEQFGGGKQIDISMSYQPWSPHNQN